MASFEIFLTGDKECARGMFNRLVGQKTDFSQTGIRKNTIRREVDGEAVSISVYSVFYGHDFLPYLKCHGVIIAYDVSKSTPESMMSDVKKKGDVSRYTGEIVLVGHNRDLSDEKAYEDFSSEYTHNHVLKSFEVNLMTGINVEKVLHTLIRELKSKPKSSTAIPDAFLQGFLSRNLGSNITTISPIQSFSDNDSYWRKCLAHNDKRYAYKALRKNELPDQDELNDLVQHFGRKSKVISAICDKISSYIKAKDECIVDVWAAYKVGCNNIVFVIIVDKRINMGKNVEYSFIKKQKGDASFEGEDVINKSTVTDISSADKELLRKSINLNNVDLMKKHKYLMMISGSPVRSKGFDTHSHTVTSETCIVLYVLVKGFMPIREDPFEKQYNGVAVDVREGFFQLFTGTANTYHEHLKNGCQVHREQLGTMGGFVDYQGFGTCGITCAHVLLNPRDMNSLSPSTENMMDYGFSALGQTVYQPDNTQERHAIGKVLKAIYKQGGGGESGMDIALVKIDQRYPQFGDFPSLEDGNPSNIQFDSGKTAHYAGIQSGDVRKFGATTGLTNGSMVMDTNTLSVRTYQPYTYNEDYEIILHNLLEIRTTVGHSSFAEPGDSGALVFCTGENNELCCVGVVEGGTKHKTCVVMPITPILQQLNLVSLKCFDKNRMLEHFERQIGESFAQLKNEIIQTSNTIHSAYSSLETRISQNEQTTQTAFATILQKLNQLDQKMHNNQNTNQ